MHVCLCEACGLHTFEFSIRLGVVFLSQEDAILNAYRLTVCENMVPVFLQRAEKL